MVRGDARRVTRCRSGQCPRRARRREATEPSAQSLAIPSVPGDKGQTSPAVTPELKAAAAAVQARVVNFVRTNGTQHSFATYADPLTGKVVLETDAPSTVVSSLVGLEAGVVEVRTTKVSDIFNRRDDIAPFWGGAGIRVAGGGTCSSGYTVRNSAGTRFMITAGHCSPTAKPLSRKSAVASWVP